MIVCYPVLFYVYEITFGQNKQFIYLFIIISACSFVLVEEAWLDSSLLQIPHSFLAKKKSSKLLLLTVLSLLLEQGYVPDKNAMEKK